MSVITPVRGRRRQLHELLSSLSEQDCVRDLEVIVVDNPQPSNRAWLETTTWPFTLRHEHRPVANRGIARNAGAAVARAEWLLFADSDIVLTPSTISNLLKMVGDHPRGVFMADVLFPPAMPRTLASHLLDVGAYFRRYRRQARMGALTFREFVSCAFIVSRDVFATVGGFDSGFDNYGYEDVEFALRAQMAGCSFRLASSQVYHLKRLDPTTVLEHAVEVGRSAVRLVELHPDIEQTLPIGVADTQAGILFFAKDFDIASLLASARSVERRWGAARRTRDLRYVRALVDDARSLYAEIGRYGRFKGIITELTGATT